MILQLLNVFNHANRQVAVILRVDKKEEEIVFFVVFFLSNHVPQPICHSRTRISYLVHTLCLLFLCVPSGVPPADRRLPAQVPRHPRVPELPDDRAVREADRHGVVPRGRRSLRGGV